MRVGEHIFHEVAEGNGPVNALNRALRKAIQGFYPRLRDVHLVDYKVRILTPQEGTKAVTRVMIESAGAMAGGEVRHWTTVGVSPAAASRRRGSSSSRRSSTATPATSCGPRRTPSSSSGPGRW